jgi:exodeoxyribonuclease VII large subunit
MLSRPDFADDEMVPPADAALSVSDLNRRARQLLERGIPPLRVRGEISGFTRAASGHVYFSLKDATAQVRCAMWRARAATLAFEPRNGDAVEVQAAVTVFEARGEYQLSVESMRRGGAGTLFEAFLRLKQKLEGEGLFDPARKRPLPHLPRAIAVITSLQAAALRDVLTTLKRRAPMIPVIVYATPVQGDAAGASIVAAIQLAGARATADGADVVILCRGGGSIEDLWPFNEEAVARAIAACPLPVVAGVGHETDVTIADWVADVRAPTPTAAAELAVPDVRVLKRHLASQSDLLRRGFSRRANALSQRLDWLARALASPSARLALQRQTLARSTGRLTAAMQGRLSDCALAWSTARAGLRSPGLAHAALRWQHARQRLAEAAAARLDDQERRLMQLHQGLKLLSPARVLERGYALVQQADGPIVRDSAQLRPGQSVLLSFGHGTAAATVDRVDRNPVVE